MTMYPTEIRALPHNNIDIEYSVPRIAVEILLAPAQWYGGKRLRQIDRPIGTPQKRFF